MNIEIKNFGPIASGAVNTDKQLILMCGSNSTGKTYLSFLLTALYSRSRAAQSSVPESIYQDIALNGGLTLKKEYIDSYLIDLAASIKQDMSSIFGLSKEEGSKSFRYLSLNFSMTDEEYEKYVIDREYSRTLRLEDSYLWIEKKAKSDLVQFLLKYPDDSQNVMAAAVPPVIIFETIDALARRPIEGARMLTVERNSVYTFSKELSLTRNDLVDRLLDLQGGGNAITDMVRKNSQRYPMPVRESLRVANDLENIQKNRSPYYDCAVQIERELLNGTLGISKTGSVEFMMGDGKKKRRIQIQMSSSMIKTLSSLTIYLKYLATKNDLLIIDEPEMNLHPSNQRTLARILARLVNNGLRLVISTHSDYIIREFNNMIMAYELYGVRKDKSSAPIYDKIEWLDPAKMEVLCFTPAGKKKSEIHEVKIDEFGFNVESIDNTIISQNNDTQNLYESLKYGC